MMQPSLPALGPDDARSILANHIVFHKSILEEDEDGSKLDHYMELIQEMDKDSMLAAKDPYDRSILITFQLVAENQMDPWNIDLVRFSRDYLKRICKDKEVDLITAGHIAYMAWTVLKLQSDDLISSCEEHGPEETQFWDGFDGDWCSQDEDFDYTMAVVNSPEPPIKEMVWRKGKRPVTLMELVDAFEAARDEAVLFAQINKQRERLRRDWELTRDLRLTEKMHHEDLEGDIKDIWARICCFNGTAIPISKIWHPDRGDRIMTLVSILFLAHRKKVRIEQPDFPFGEIFIKNISLGGEYEGEDDEHAQDADAPKARLTTAVQEKLIVRNAPKTVRGQGS